MIPASLIKHVSSLKISKYRELQGQTIAEGTKLVRDMLMTGHPFIDIFATERWMADHGNIWRIYSNKITPCSEKELTRMSALKSPQGVLAVIPTLETGHPLPDTRLSIYCDGIGDPGNMGTILRIADWFGIGQVITAPGSASINNPKVIQASMGSVFRVHHASCNLQELIGAMPTGTRVCAAVTDGEPLHLKTYSDQPVILVVGNEARGISADNLVLCTDRITIPGKQASQPGESAESLNAAIATAIMSYHFTLP
jgi:RNA methyltransferase, TrmH family